MKILITRKLPEKFINQLSDYEVDMYDSTLEAMPNDLLNEKAKHSDIIITMLSDQIDETFLKANRHLKAVINLAVGYDNIDIECAHELDIIVCNTPDVLTETTAELAFTLMLTSARRVVEASQMLHEGKWVGWSPYLLAGSDVHHKTVGIFGMGKIGLAFARRCKGFDMNVLYHNRSKSNEAASVNANYVSFEALLQNSDYIICCAPLTEATKGIFNQSAFKKMKKTAYFINIGRGGHVVEHDLLHAIQDGDILGAGLDVYQTEPIDMNHPFLNEPNITMLPHIGSSTTETRDAMIQLCIDNALCIANGKQPKTQIII